MRRSEPAARFGAPLDPAALKFFTAPQRELVVLIAETIIPKTDNDMGTARMGDSPKNSVHNKGNQVWGAPNVFCTDGASMTSAGCQYASLTCMALTARAVDHAVSEAK